MNFCMCEDVVTKSLKIKTHSSVSEAKKTKEDVQHTSVLFVTGPAKIDHVSAN